MERRRTSLAVPMQRLHRAEIGLPNELAADVQAIEAERTEEGKDVLAVGHSRIRGQAGRMMSLLLRQPFAERMLPKDFAAGPMNGENHEFVPVGDRKIVMIASRRARASRQCFAKRNCGGEKDPFPPYDRSGVTATKDFGLPADVRPVRLVPGQRRIAAGRFPRGQRPAPLPPVLHRFTSGGRLRSVCGGCQQEGNDGELKGTWRQHRNPRRRGKCEALRDRSA